jgi:hypothetical protein
MRPPMRLFLAILVVLLLVFLGILFSSSLYDFVVTPIAVLLLLLWRMVESVDQAVYWGMLVVTALFYSLYRIFGHLLKWTPEETISSPEDDNALRDIRYWHRSILLSREVPSNSNHFKRDLQQLVAARYASQLPGGEPATLLEILAQRQDSLPEPVRAFLFPDEPKPERPIPRLVRKLRETPGQWRRRWSGRDVTEYYDSIDAVLNLLESSLEIDHDAQS